MFRNTPLLLAAALIGVATAETTGFVSTKGTDFVLDGATRRFAGTNCYYILYASNAMVDDALSRSAKHGFDVVRTWAFIDIGTRDGQHGTTSAPIKNGVYFQFWDEAKRAPSVNETNLQHLDYVVHRAKQLNLRLILTLTNNWADFGGIDQYLIWKQLGGHSGALNHDDFYVDGETGSWFKAWVSTLLNRVNTYTKVAYKDEPAIFAWELANEPRCQGTGMFGESDSCVKNYAVYGKQPEATRVGAWVREMSDYIKSIDSKHMVATGDEGYLCETYQACPDVTCDCYYGVDAANFTKHGSIDFMSMHLYPSTWGKPYDWGTAWIANHTKIAHGIGKPVLLGEYGAQGATQHSVYQTWSKTILESGTNGDLFWMISGKEDASWGSYWYPNYDGFAVYCPNATEPAAPGDAESCGVLTEHAKLMNNPK